MVNINNKRTIKIFFWHFCNGLYCWYSSATALHKNSVVVVLLQPGSVQQSIEYTLFGSMAYWVFVLFTLSRSSACTEFGIIVAVGNLFYFVWVPFLSLFLSLCIFLLLFFLKNETCMCLMFFDSFFTIFNGATHATKHAISIIFPINEKLKGRSCSRLQKM